MIVKELKITNFRNIDSEKIVFNPKINVLYGENAQGKTNIIEGLSYLSLLKSFRGSENKNLIKVNEDFANVEIVTSDNKKLKCVISKEKRQCFLNDVKIKKLSDFIGIINVVVFSPENVNLFKDSPSERRNFLDDEISKLSPSYYVCVNDYKEVKKERNELLRYKDKIDQNLFLALTSQIARYNYQIVKKRKQFVENLNRDITGFYQKLTGSSSKLEIVYQSDFADCQGFEEIVNKLVENKEEDIQKEQTLLGIHRDDLLLKLEGQEIAEFGSQAQNRLAVVSLKLATLRVVKESTGDEGIVVLDDVLSELDENKQNRLLTELKINNQIFITSAIKVNIENKEINSYCVEQGKIRRA